MRWLGGRLKIIFYKENTFYFIEKHGPGVCSGLMDSKNLLEQGTMDLRFLALILAFWHAG
uniref:Uncharacterized protein n=1 Tax=Meloidogyne incognita TaxID=6306 RepID=A0A914NJ44_MELIC